MSYIQPFITSAFSSYTVNFTSRHTAGTQRNDGTAEDKAIGIVSGNGKIVADKNNAVVGAVSRTQESKTDADSGKPKSASGDILDLSDKMKSPKASKEEFDSAANFDKETNSGTNAEAGSSGIELQDTANTENNVPLAGSLKSDTKSEDELTDEEKQQVSELKARDAEVRLHESRHLAVAGQYATSGPSYTYQTGPDGKKYAIGGEVGIDISPVEGDPEATIQKMQTVVAAATAPAEPSGQDYKVAATARQEIAKAQTELNNKSREEETGNEKGISDSAPQLAAGKEETDNNNSAKQLVAGEKTSIKSHYTKSFAAGSIGKMISGQASGTRFSAFA